MFIEDDGLAWPLLLGSEVIGHCAGFATAFLAYAAADDDMLKHAQLK